MRIFICTFCILTFSACPAVEDSKQSASDRLCIQIDFQGEAGGAYGSKEPIRATANTECGRVWNAYTHTVFDGDFNEAVHPKVLKYLQNARGERTEVSIQLHQRVLAYNSPECGHDAESLEAALCDHIFFAQGDGEKATENPIEFTFQNVPAGTYRLVAFANPTAHVPPRDFTLLVGDKAVAIKPVFGWFSNRADIASVYGEIAPIEVTANGVLHGAFEYQGKTPGDPSVAALQLIAVTQ